MAKFNIEYADKPVKVQAVDAYARPQTETFGAIAQAGQALFSIGKDLQQQKDALEYSEGQRQITEQAHAALNALTGDETTDRQVWEKLQQDINNVQFSNNRVNRALTIYRNQTLPTIQQTVTNRHKNLLQQNVHDGFIANGQTLLVRGDLTGYQDLLDLRLQTKDISQAEYQALSGSMFVDSVLEQSRDLIASGNAAQNTVAMNLLATVPAMDTATTEKKEYAQKLLSMARQRETILSDEANKELTDLMIAGTLNTDDVMKRRMSLKDSDYQTWAKIAMNPVDKAGNIIKETELKTKAIDVWRGTLSRTDLEKEIRQSLQEPTGINDKQYAAIYDDLNREVRSYQAQDMKSYAMEATQLILGKDAGVVAFDALGNVTYDITKLLSPQTEFEKKMRFVEAYNRGMSEYLAENPAVSKKDLYIKSQELKATYLAASKGQTDTAPSTPKPAGYPDAVWNADYKMWTVIRNGRLMGVQ